MDAFECIATKLDVMEFSPRAVPPEVKKKILEAARLTGSGRNIQHWRFILVQEPENLKKVFDASVSGKWVSSANFAVLLLTDPQYNFHLLDAGRVLQDMEVTAWNYGVASRFYTRSDKEAMSKYFNLPMDLNLTAVLGFGYPAKKVVGRKNRKPLSELAFSEKYGQELKI